MMFPTCPYIRLFARPFVRYQTRETISPWGQQLFLSNIMMKKISLNVFPLADNYNIIIVIVVFSKGNTHNDN